MSAEEIPEGREPEVLLTEMLKALPKSLDASPNTVLGTVLASVAIQMSLQEKVLMDMARGMQTQAEAVTTMWGVIEHNLKQGHVVVPPELAAEGEKPMTAEDVLRKMNGDPRLMGAMSIATLSCSSAEPEPQPKKAEPQPKKDYFWSLPEKK